MSEKKYLIKKLLEYPEISNDEYISLVKQKNKLINENHYNEIDEIDKIDKKLNIHIEKQMIISLIKNSPVSSPIESHFRPPPFFRALS